MDWSDLVPVVVSSAVISAMVSGVINWRRDVRTLRAQRGDKSRDVLRDVVVAYLEAEGRRFRAACEVRDWIEEWQASRDAGHPLNRIAASLDEAKLLRRQAEVDSGNARARLELTNADLATLALDLSRTIPRPQPDGSDPGRDQWSTKHDKFIAEARRVLEVKSDVPQPRKKSRWRRPKTTD